MRIAFDIDDILWPLNIHICEKHGINYDDITEFKVPRNIGITEEERNILMNEYHNVKVFKQLKFYDGAQRIRSIMDNGHDVWIFSHSLSQDIVDVKIERLTKELNIPENKIICSIINKEQVTKEKELPNDLDYFIDDSPYNIAKSNAKENLLIRTPWNCSSNAKKIMSGKVYKYFGDLNKVIDYIEKNVIT